MQARDLLVDANRRLRPLERAKFRSRHSAERIHPTGDGSGDRYPRPLPPGRGGILTLGYSLSGAGALLSNRLASEAFEREKKARSERSEDSAARRLRENEI